MGGFSPELARMSVRPFQQRDSDLELQMIADEQERIDAATARIAHYDAASLQYIADQIQNWATAYPTMDPIVAYESVTLGIPFDSEIGMEIARESTAFIEEQRQGALPFIGDRILEASGEALFSDAGQFIGYSGLDDEENDMVVRFIANQEQGPDGAIYDAAIRNGTFNAGDLIRETRAIYAPYSELIGKVSPDLRTYNQFVEDVYLMPSTVVAELNKEFGEGTVFNSSMVARRVRELHENNDDWREASIRMTDEEQESFDQINARIESAREGREGDGGFLEGLKSITQPIAAAAISPGQYFLNKARSYINTAQNAGQGMVAQAAFGPTGEGVLTGSPTIMNPTGLTTQAQLPNVFLGNLAKAGFETARYGSAFTPIGRAAGVGTLGAIGLRGALALGPEAAELVANSGPSAVQRQAADATDLGIFMDDPSLAGDGWLLGGDLIRERQRREAEFTPVFANGDYFTFGRGIARGVGFELDSTGYNVLSGTVDAFLAFRGPGEVIPDAAAEIGLKARYLPGLRQVPLIGRSDPLINAGGIRIRNRPAILRPTTDEWLSSWRGRLVSQRLAEIDNVYDVMSTAKNKMDVFTARNIARATTADEVTDILRASMGIGVQNTPRLSYRGSLKHVKRPLDWDNWLSRFATRLGARVPSTSGNLVLADIDAVYRYMDDIMKNVSMKPADRKAYLNRVADAPWQARFDVILDMEDFIKAQSAARIANRRAKSITGRLESAAIAAGQKITGKPGYLAARKARIEKHAEDEMKKITQHFKNSSSTMTLYNIDQVGDIVASPLGRAPAYADEVVNAPHLDIELATEVPFLGITDIRQLRKTNKPAYDLLSNLPLYREFDEFLMPVPRAVLEFLTIAIFKTAAVLRPAYIMRVIPEEQFRIAAMGGDAFFNNPMALFAWMTGRGGRGLDLNMNALSESAEAAGVRITRGPRDEARVVQSNYLRARKGEDAFAEGWGGELAQLSASPIGRYVAANPMTPIPGKVPAGQPQRYSYTSAQLDAAMDEFDETWRAFAEGDPTSNFRQLWDAGDQRGAVRNFLESVERRIAVKTGGSGSLREAIAIGKLDVGGGKSVPVQGSGRSVLQANKQFIDALGDDALDLMKYAPDELKVLKQTSEGPDRISMTRDFLDAMGAAILEKPTTLLSREPTFAQNYWSGVAEHGRHLSAAGAAELRQNIANLKLGTEIRKAVDKVGDKGGKIRLSPRAASLAGLKLAKDGTVNVSAKTVSRLKNKFEKITLAREIEESVQKALDAADGSMRLKDFDLLMKGQAMDKTNDLLFSMATRQQWQDAVRIAAPFAAAWQEVLTTWTKIALDDPFKLGRIEQAERVLGDPDFSAVVDRFPLLFDTLDGRGMIYTDDFGQKRIIVPFAGIYRGAARKIGLEGAPGLSGAYGDSIALQSLNVGAGFLPGLGPAASFGVSEIFNELQQRAGIDLRQAETPLGRIEELLFPFGETKLEVFNPETWLNLGLPSWGRYALLLGGSLTDDMSGLDEDNYNGRVIATMQWLLMNDPQRYDLGNLEKRQLLLSDATDQVLQDAFVAFISALLGPGPVRRESFILDENGQVQVNIDGNSDSTFMTYLSTASLYRSFLDEATDAGLPYAEAEAIAWARTTELSGSTGFIAKGKTRSMLMGSVPVTREAYNWLQDNPDVRTYAKDTWQFFAPYVPNGELYMPMYLESIDQGDRERLTPEEWLEFAQDMTAQLLYDNHVRSLGNLGDYAPDVYRAEISEYSDILQKAYPDWRNTDQQGTPADFAQVQTELGVLTAEGGQFENHEIAPAVQEALRLREQAEQRAEDIGLTGGFLDAKRAAWIRTAYDIELTNLVSTYPEANFVIERAFRGEIRNKLFEDLED
jgi:hypothetical protein